MVATVSVNENGPGEATWSSTDSGLGRTVSVVAWKGFKMSSAVAVSKVGAMVMSRP